MVSYYCFSREDDSENNKNVKYDGVEGPHMEVTEEEIENRLLEISDTKNYSGWSLIIVSAIGMVFSFLAPFLPGLAVSVLLFVCGIALVMSAHHDRRMVISHYEFDDEETEPEEDESSFMPGDTPGTASGEDTGEQGPARRYGKPLTERFPELFPEEEGLAAGGSEDQGTPAPAPPDEAPDEGALEEPRSEEHEPTVPSLSASLNEDDEAAFQPRESQEETEPPEKDDPEKKVIDGLLQNLLSEDDENENHS